MKTWKGLSKMKIFHDFNSVCSTNYANMKLCKRTIFNFNWRFFLIEVWCHDKKYIKYQTNHARVKEMKPYLSHQIFNILFIF